MVLPADEQMKLVEAAPKVFAPAKGTWGKRGSTQLRLKNAGKARLKLRFELPGGNERPNGWRLLREHLRERKLAV